MRLRHLYEDLENVQSDIDFGFDFDEDKLLKLKMKKNGILIKIKYMEDKWKGSNPWLPNDDTFNE